MKRIWIWAVLVLLLVACNRPNAATPTPTATAPAASITAPATTVPLPSRTASPTPPAPTITPPASATPSPTFTPAPSATPAEATATLVPSLTPTSPPAATATLAPQPTPVSVVMALPLGAPLMVPPAGSPDGPLVGVTSLAVDTYHPGNALVAAGTNAYGVLLSRDGGATWAWSREGLPAEVDLVGVTISGQVLAAWDVNGAAYQSWDAGANWELMTNLTGVSDMVLSPDYTADHVLFAVRAGGLWRSTDGGQSGVEVLPPTNCPLNVALSPQFSLNDLVYAPRCDQVARSTDAGRSWQMVERQDSLFELGPLINLRMVTEQDGSSTLLSQGRTQGLPLVSTDGGATWQRAYDPDRATFTLGTLRTVKVGPDGSWFVAGTSYQYQSGIRVWQSTDRGQTWADLGWATGLSSLAVGGDGAVWLGTPDGVFKRTPDWWQWIHAGGNRLESVLPADSGVALISRGVDKYTAEWRLFEKQNNAWEYVLRETVSMNPRRAFIPPNYAQERSLLALAMDYGGVVHVISVHANEADPIQNVDALPTGPADTLDQYEVSYSEDYANSGRIDLRVGYSGALYQSADRGATWTRPDPAELGACARNPVSGFGALWLQEDQLRSRLLCPLEDEQGYSGTVQPFEHGELLRLAATDTEIADVTIYGLAPEWTGASSWTTLPLYEIGPPYGKVPAGFYSPDPVFYAAWGEGVCCRPEPQPITDVLGWGTGEAVEMIVARQRFEGGTLIWRSDRDEILVLERTALHDAYSIYPDPSN